MAKLNGKTIKTRANVRHCALRLSNTLQTVREAAQRIAILRPLVAHDNAVLL